jgi:steroid delta-isomerase-like uncharacterized protein
MKIDDNKALVRRWFEEVWNQGREDTIDEMYTSDGVSFGLGGANTEVRGPAEFKIFFRNLRSAFPDTHVRLLDILAEGNEVAVRFEVQATHTGNGLPFPPTGRAVKFSGMSILEVSDGKLTKGWNCWDQLGMLIQIGVISSAADADDLLKRHV